MAKKNKITVVQTRSIIKRPSDQQRTIKALGLGRVNKSVELEATPQVMGMINKVKHLVSVS